MNNETETLSCNVTLTWSASTDKGCPLTMYSVHHIQMQPPEKETTWHEVNITDIMETRHDLFLRCGRVYMIEMYAWNELGRSGSSNVWIIKTMSGRLISVDNWNSFLCRKDPISSWSPFVSTGYNVFV